MRGSEISVQSITDETDYLRAVEKSIYIKSDDIVNEEVRRLNNENEKQIKKIEKKYSNILKRLDAILNNPNITEEQKGEILSVIGYDEELKPYLETRSMLYDNIHNRKLSLKRKA